jgi:parallel beta-helix repeat protein
VISPIVFPKDRRSEILLATTVAKGDRSFSLAEFRLNRVGRASVLSLSVGISLALLTFLGSSVGSAFGQVPPVGEKQISQVNVLFVNPGIGEDKEGNGGENNPFKTITQALQKATPNTVITLTPGTYSSETGEVFPLIFRQGVSILGDASNQGQGIRIQGGGEYLSRSYGGQNVTIVGANQANLTGVTVSNPNPRGYGLWIESSNLVASQNTFTGNTQDGVFVTGTATPTISQNNFYRNGANGITLAGTSQAQVRENIFQETGYGINIAQNAAPVILNNQIQRNRSGIIVQANARPVLRNNIIEGSKEDGIVAIAQAMPDLGNNSEPGGNQFSNNARYDINANAAKQLISAVGNNLRSDRIAGRVDLQANRTFIAGNTQPPASGGPQEIPTNGEIIFAAPGLSKTPSQVNLPSANNSNSRNNVNIGKLNPQLLPLHQANTSRTIPTPNPVQPTPPVNSPVAGFPVPSSLVGGQTSIANVPPVGNPGNVPQLNYVQINTNAIEFTPPQPPRNSVVKPVSRARGKKQSSQRRRPTPVGNSNLLPVPNSNIPIGNTRNMRKVPVPEGYPTGNYGVASPNNITPVSPDSLPNAVAPMGNSPIPNSATTPMSPNSLPAILPMGSNPPSTGGMTPMSVRFRVLVEVANERDQEVVRYLIPGAFSTVSQGRNFMQAGVFSNRANAEGIANMLNGNGLRAVIEVLN